ncbi:Hypothetical protein AT6N2_L1732 [Agrobacterium tumefaciens]|nr:Hypothetical protein AT6N2_L1732 [Agrobacterium tumefaciens]
MGGRHPEVRVLIIGRVGHASQMKGLTPFHACAAAAAVAYAALVTGPCFAKRRAVFYAIVHDGRLGNGDIGREEFHISIAFKRVRLHGIEAVDEARPAVGVDEMIAAVNGNRHCIRLLCGSQPERDGEHDGIAVRHHGGTHRLLRIMPVRHLHIIGQCGTGEVRADGSDIDDMMRHTEPSGAIGGKIQFLPVALAIIEGDESKKVMFRGDFMRKRNGVQSAGADDDGFHSSGSLVLTGWAATG